MLVSRTPLAGVLVLEPDVFGDSRGLLFEVFNAKRFEELTGLNVSFVQDNFSVSARNVLRGLHLQQNHAQGKLITVFSGSIFDVVADVNPSSSSYGTWAGFELDAENHKQVYVPPGFAHGFVATADIAAVGYKCTDYYAPGDEVSIRWDDPQLAIDWPVDQPILSEKDSSGLSLQQYADRLSQ